MVEEPSHFDKEKGVLRDTVYSKQSEVKLAEKWLEHLRGGFDCLKPDRDWSERERVKLQLTALGFDSLRWSLEVMLKGYYVQAIALARLAWESWLNTTFLVLNPEFEIESWENFKKRPRPSEMRKKVAEKPPEGSEVYNKELLHGLNKMYKGYSGYSHPSQESLQVLIADDGNGRLTLNLGGAYNEQQFLQSVNYFFNASSMISSNFLFLLEDFESFNADGDELIGEVNEWRASLI